MGFLSKLLKWVPVNLAGFIGVLQVVVKALKEILTVVVDILFPIIPSSKFQGVVVLVRGIVNKADAILEKIKGFLLKVVP